MWWLDPEDIEWIATHCPQCWMHWWDCECDYIHDNKEMGSPMGKQLVRNDFYFSNDPTRIMIFIKKSGFDYNKERNSRFHGQAVGQGRVLSRSRLDEACNVCGQIGSRFRDRQERERNRK